MKLFTIILMLSIAFIQTGCTSFKPYVSDSSKSFASNDASCFSNVASKSFASNVAKAAGVYKLDVSRAEFIQSYGKAVNNTDLSTLSRTHDYITCCISS